MLESRIDILIKLLYNRNKYGIIIPSNDAFQSEYVPPHSRRLEWLTGFCGSNGLAIVLVNGEAAFFTDGRYTIQAAAEVSAAFKRYNLTDKKPHEWLAEHADGMVIAFDPWLHTKEELLPYRKTGKFKLEALESNLIDEIWQDRPVPDPQPIVEHPIEFSGKKREHKLRSIIAFLKERKADYILLTAPDSICWLLNIRGNDVPCTPLVLAYALVSKEGKVVVFTENARAEKSLLVGLGEMISFHSIDKLETFINNLEYNKIVIDKSNAPEWFSQHLNEKKIDYHLDPCQLPKAIKNQQEIHGTRQAHIRDGVALSKGLFWIEEQLKAGHPVLETDVADKLIELRSQQEHFKQPSFGTIAGCNENGAIVHYQSKKETALALNNNDESMLLLDSGGQYLDGTTDITRTIALGTPSQEQKERFTQVLKGHIALARAVFPIGTTGSALDVLARQSLWNEGVDFSHGTGHGVGSYLGVHEGPQRISKFPSTVALKPGMIISNEPGFYKADEYGIRIESLVLVVKHPSYQDFLAFETISRAPIDLRLIDADMLSLEERNWLNDYHARVNEDIASCLNKQEKKWLNMATREIC